MTTTKKPTTKKPTTKKPTTKKPTTAATKKAPAKKAPAKKAAPSKAPVKKAAAKKAPAAKTPAKVAKTKAAPKASAPKKAAAGSAGVPSGPASKKSPAPAPVERKIPGSRQERQTAKAAENIKRATETANSGATVNHVVFVIDRSGSMSSIRRQVAAVFNDQLSTMKKSSVDLNQPTFVTIYTFNSAVGKPEPFVAPIEKVAEIKPPSCTGGTALYDATGQAIVDMQALESANKDNVSFMVLVLTDGAENSSRKYRDKIKDMIQKVQDTGRWTLAFLTPPGGERTLESFGIPSGNIQIWQTSAAGMQKLRESMQQGMGNFYAARQTGQKAVVGVFTTNMANVSVEKVTAELVDVSADFLKLPVATASDIRTLVDSSLAGTGKKFQKGNGFYELTKPELVQERKELAIVDKASGKIYAGANARSMLGLPDGTRCKVKPGDHGAFQIFVQSTSVNRVLVLGSTLLYRK